MCSDMVLCAAAGGGDATAGPDDDLSAMVAELRSELAAAQAAAAESHQKNLTLGAELTVMERTKMNQVGTAARFWLCGAGEGVMQLGLCGRGWLLEARPRCGLLVCLFPAGLPHHVNLRCIIICAGHAIASLTHLSLTPLSLSLSLTHTEREREWFLLYCSLEPTRLVTACDCWSAG